MVDLVGRVLIIDDDESIRIGCRQVLESSGFSIAEAESGMRALERIRRESFDIALLDLGMPGLPGIEVLKRLKAESPNMAVIVITGQAAFESAVEAVKQGAFDYLPKPFTPEALTIRVQRAASAAMRALENACLDEELDRKMLSQALIGRSEAMSRVVRLVQRAAPLDSSVLITGEAGVGKETVARAIHKLSRRAGRPFVVVDCSTPIESLFERELFGYVKGAFSGAMENALGKMELADGGTLFLDEIATISAEMQARLFRAIQDREISHVGSAHKRRIDVRIISASSHDLQLEMREGKLREDLYYRLNAIRVPIPPLRERLEDIPALADYYIKKLSSEMHRPGVGISEDAMRNLKRSEWPGNVRELIDVLHNAIATCEGKTIGLKDLPREEPKMPDPDKILGGSLARLEKKEILNALEQFHGNKSRAAEYLGINRKTLREKMQKYGIPST